MAFRVEENADTKIIKDLFVEYSHIKGAESCFVSFDKELNDLEGYYSGGAILTRFEEDKPVACVAFRKINDETSFNTTAPLKRSICSPTGTSM